MASKKNAKSKRGRGKKPTARKPKRRVAPRRAKPKKSARARKPAKGISAKTRSRTSAPAPSKKRPPTAPPKAAAGGDAAAHERALRERALAFHRVLAEHGVYITAVSEEDFLAKVGPTIVETATSVAKGQGNGSLERLALPVTLLYKMKDWVPTIEWDYEFGLESLFEDLGPMFDKAGSRFTWKRVEGDRDRYEYTLDGQTLAIEPSDPVEIDFRDFAAMVKAIEGVLAPRAKKIYQPVTGDQSGRLVVIPANSEAALREILISADDPRAEEFY